MAGFETAIRNALARAPNGRAETRERVYAAARASLERNLAARGSDAATAAEQRSRLEATIVSIEQEHGPAPAESAPPAEPATTAAPPTSDAPRPAAGTARPAPPAPRAAPPTTAADTPAAPHGDGPTAPESADAVGPAARPSTNHVAGRASTDPSPGVARGETAGPAVSGHAAAPPRHDRQTDRTGTPPLDDAVAGGTVSPPDARPAASLAPRQERELLVAPPSDSARSTAEVTRAEAIARAVDAEAERSRRGGMGGTGGGAAASSDRVRSGAASEAVVANAVPATEPATDARLAEPGDSASAVEIDEASGVGAVTVDDRAVPGRRGRKAAKQAPQRKSSQRKSSQRKPSRRSARREKRKQGRRGRWVSRLVSLAALLLVGVFGWQWIGASGLLERRETARAPITAPSGRPADEPTSSVSAGTEGWVDLFLAEDDSAEGRLRVAQATTVPLDVEALASLGERVRIALLVRSASETRGMLAVTCDFGGVGCGRTRFPVPREATELLLDADLAAGASSLTLDPTIGAENVPVELIAVRARAL